MGGGHGMDMPEGYEIPPIVPDSSYFTHTGYSNMIIAHILFMTLAWVFVLPICKIFPFPIQLPVSCG
jgi:hypothetical protein